MKYFILILLGGSLGFVLGMLGFQWNSDIEFWIIYGFAILFYLQGLWVGGMFDKIKR